MTTVMAAPAVTRPQAIGIAEADAVLMYGKYLHTLVLEMSLHDNGWHLEYRPRRDGYRTGGGPHYVIDAETGAIVSKTYYQ
ncbi:hypothetical protein [Frigoriglobus tundricola]|uniref:PepSY domain-containing protein n=1 Tax=Frigoriglobus tundricola TaxID=2774151 RepID=A0A6M5Z1I2_9BACT|nr:hypothetical protein [Frigoriglobus tundricola]QJW99955.1 hypothetical protein FTUN_7578 [Frigoriglobus tundricola]